MMSSGFLLAGYGLVGAIEELKNYIKKYKPITPLYSAYDTQYNNAVALQSLIKRIIK